VCSCFTGVLLCLFRFGSATPLAGRRLPEAHVAARYATGLSGSAVGGVNNSSRDSMLSERVTGSDFAFLVVIAVMALTVLVAAALAFRTPRQRREELAQAGAQTEPIPKITAPPVSVAPAYAAPYPFGEDTNPPGFPPGWG